MENYNYEVKKNQAINRWLYTDLKIEPYLSEKATFSHEVNLTEEYLQIEYPVRKQFLRERTKKKIQKTADKFSHVYFPFENPRFEFSSFISNPHILSVYGKTFINLEQDSSLPFFLSTCGSVVIWVNGTKQVEYSPFTRNQPSTTEIKLEFKKGNNEIIIYMEDLAERDVNYFMELKYVGKNKIEGFIPVNASIKNLKQAEKLLSSMYLSKDLYTTGHIELQMDPVFASNLNQLFININKNKLINPVFDKSQNEHNLIYDYQFNLSDRDGDKLMLMPVCDFHSQGLKQLDILFVVDDKVEISRRIVVSITHENPFEKTISDDLAVRKQEVLKYFTENAITDLNTGIAMAHLQGKLSEEAIIHIKSCFPEIEQKSDCADFRLAPLLAFMIKYQSLIPQSFKTQLEELVTNFRYWIDEPGNDVMWWFSENHAFLFHVSQYLAGYLYPNKVFTVSERTGSEQYLIGKQRLKEWFDIFFKYGYSEWNSTTYLPIDLIGFFSLYETAPDKEIRDLAKKALDFTFKIIAVNMHDKTMSSTYGRVYEHDLKSMESGEVANLSFITWKKGHLNTAMRSTTLFCISDYVPPGLESYLLEEDHSALLTQYIQGIKKVYTYHYKTKAYSMCAAINFNTFKKGHQQHTMNLSLGRDNTQIWINHPGESVFSGENRPSFWAGNGICPNIRQYRNYMMIEYRLREPYLPYIHAYLPFWKLDDIIERDQWLFIRKEDTYLAIYFENDFDRINEGATAFREIRSYGMEHKVFITCSSNEEHDSFKVFMNEQLNSIMIKDQNNWSYHNERVGTLGMVNQDLYLNQQKIEYQAGYDIVTNFYQIWS